MEAALAHRLERGAELINRRKWGKRSLRYVQGTVQRFPDVIGVWVQAFTLAGLARDNLAALFYYACTPGAYSNLSAVDNANRLRDLALMLLRDGRLWMATHALRMGYAYHHGTDDPNMPLVYQMVEARIAIARRDWDAAEGILSDTAEGFRRLAATGRVNHQWQFNCYIQQLRMATRRGNWHERWDLLEAMRMDECFTFKHAVIATVIAWMPFAWRWMR